MTAAPIAILASATTNKSNCAVPATAPAGAAKTALKISRGHTRGDVTDIGAGTNCGSTPLAPGGSCTLHTSFDPSGAGRAQVRVYVFDQNSAAATARVTGVGIAG